MMPSNTDLLYFMEIAHQGNLTRAANTLGVSQPTLTLAMQRLEHTVGVDLFIRSRQGVKLTKAGERFLIGARKLSGQWDELRQSTVDAMNDVRGRFHLGCHPSVARYSLPLFLPKLLEEHPHLEIELQHDLSRNITRKVVDMDIDIGIVVNPEPHADLIMKKLAEDVVTLWKSHKLKNEDVLIYEPSLFQSQEIRGKLHRSDPKFSRGIESSNLEVIAGLVSCGAGIGILPTRVALKEDPDLLRVKGAPVFHDEISLIYRVENRQVRAVETLSKAIQMGFK